VKRILFLLTIILHSVFLYSQDFFEEDELVEEPASFYQTNKRISTLALVRYSDYSYGGAFYIHRNKYRLSNYFEASFKPTAQYIVTAESKEKTLKKEMSVSYYAFDIATGLAISIKSDLLFYAKYGICYKQSNSDAVKENYISSDSTFNNNTLIYYPAHRGFEFFYGAGVLYVLPSGLSAQAGYSFVRKTLDIGIGYTF